MSKNKEVWVIVHGIDYAGSGIIGVYVDEETALKKASAITPYNGGVFTEIKDVIQGSTIMYVAHSMPEGEYLEIERHQIMEKG